MTTSIRLPEELDARLERMAARTGRTKSFHIKAAIEEHIEMMKRHGVAR